MKMVQEQLSFDFGDVVAEKKNAGVIFDQGIPEADEALGENPSGFGATDEHIANKPSNSGQHMRDFDLKRAVLAWLLPQSPSGVGLRVPTRVSRFRADMAAFWSLPAKKRLLQPVRTLIVETRLDRDDCWPDCSRQEELLPLLVVQKELKLAIEAEIRAKEPSLRDSDTLFTEFESWRYSESRNRRYRSCLKKIEELERALYNGSRFEQIRRAHVADYLYLAVPEGTVKPHELADGWGLINITPDLEAKVARQAESWNCQVANRLHLAQQIAASSRDALFFSMGLRAGKDGEVLYSPPPRRRIARASR
ncbi:MAG: hypothetical protein JW808_10780 [Victivallales bacterium]|nr:hypothetical protein [Victivallales bacterium]